jgi:hypothetical protein
MSLDANSKEMNYTHYSLKGTTSPIKIVFIGETDVHVILEPTGGCWKQENKTITVNGTNPADQHYRSYLEWNCWSVPWSSDNTWITVHHSGKIDTNDHPRIFSNCKISHPICSVKWFKAIKTENAFIAIFLLIAVVLLFIFVVCGVVICVKMLGIKKAVMTLIAFVCANLGIKMKDVTDNYKELDDLIRR